MIDANARLTLRESRAITARTFGLIASALLVCSAVLQGVAAAQRWLFVDVADLAPDRTIEDHLFDYVLPADPWVSVGSAATLFGLGYLLIAAALVTPWTEAVLAVLTALSALAVAAGSVTLRDSRLRLTGH